jgi:hypothetical protein
MTKRSKKTSPRRKSHRRGGRRTETWNKKGKVRVRRNRRGQFITWRKVRAYRRGVTAEEKWKTTAKHVGARTVRTSFGGKGIAVHAGKKRIQLHGSGQQLKEVIRRHVFWHPPKEDYLEEKSIRKGLSLS